MLLQERELLYFQGPDPLAGDISSTDKADEFTKHILAEVAILVSAAFGFLEIFPLSKKAVKAVGTSDH